jgi:hypothetical protein
MIGVTAAASVSEPKYVCYVRDFYCKGSVFGCVDLIELAAARFSAN